MRRVRSLQQLVAVVAVCSVFLMEEAAVSWFYLDNSGDVKGPIPTNILMRLLDKGINISGDTTVWKEGMKEWEKMSNVHPFSELAHFLSKQWYYLDSLQTKGPILSRLLIHKLRQGEIDGFTSVFGEGMEKWMPLNEVPELKAAAQKIAEEERQTKLVMNTLPDEQSQVYVEDEIKMFDVSMKSTKKDNSDGKRFVADNGIKYAWDDTLEDWIEDDAPTESENSEEEGDDHDVDEVEIDGNKVSTSSEANEKKRKRKKKKKDTAEWKDSIGSKYWIYIQNLPLDITLDELKSHFSKVGLIALSPVDQLPKIKIYRDENGEPKGDASICYNAAESVEMSINILDGGYIRPNTKPISVSKAEFHKKDPTATPSNEKQQRKKGKITHAQVKVTQNAMAQALAWNEDDDLGVSKRRALKIVVIEGMFHPSESEGNPQFFEELEKDIAEEFEKCGPLEKITVFSRNPKGVVIVKFATSFAAQECVRVMDGRYFGGRKLRSMFWDGVTNYGEVSLGDSMQTNAEDDQRLEEFGDWLEQEQENLPEEFRLKTE